MSELVSIIMPAYNSEKYIQKSIDSVIYQTYQNWELIIVDDCSTDSTTKLITQITKTNNKIKLYKQQKNSGAAMARNQAIKLSKGSYIAFLDSDDIWDSNFLQNQLDFMKKHNYDFVYSAYDIIDELDEQIGEYYPKKQKVKYKDILKHNHIGCSTVVYNKNKLGKQYMPLNAIKREDMATWLQMLKITSYAYCNNEKLAKYRIGHTSVSKNKIKMAKYQFQLYTKVEKINLIKSIAYLLSWGIKGLTKYKLK